MYMQQNAGRCRSLNSDTTYKIQVCNEKKIGIGQKGNKKKKKQHSNKANQKNNALLSTTTRRVTERNAKKQHNIQSISQIYRMTTTKTV